MIQLKMPIEVRGGGKGGGEGRREGEVMDWIGVRSSEGGGLCCRHCVVWLYVHVHPVCDSHSLQTLCSSIGQRLTQAWVCSVFLILWTTL